jgi:hypothetical protein
MSHFTRVRTALTDATVLAAALKHLGLTNIEVHDLPQRLQGYAGRTEQAEIIIRREHLGSVFGDLGFARGADGTFDLVVDSSDRQGRHHEWLSKLPQAYGYAASLRYAEEHGYQVDTDTIEHNGTRRLTLRRST